MTSWVVWAVAVAVSGLIGFTATHFSVRTLRYVTAGTVIAALVAVTAYGQTPSGGRVPPDLETAFAFGADRLAGAWFVFSLGAVLAFAATGTGPFGTGSVPALVYRVVNEPPALSQVPRELRQTIERCLAKAPGERPGLDDLLAQFGDEVIGEHWLPVTVADTFPRYAPSVRIAALAAPEPALTGGVAAGRRRRRPTSGPTTHRARRTSTTPRRVPTPGRPGRFPRTRRPGRRWRSAAPTSWRTR